LAVQLANGAAPLVVLIVEDELLVRSDIAQYLRAYGCIVLEAWTATQAVSLGRDGQTVDVLVTDINLGTGEADNGWDVAEALRADRPGIGVVYVSGNAVDQSRRVPDSLFFEKPYQSRDILQACRQLAEA
jgi:two-component system, response regulator PdtaR